MLKYSEFALQLGLVDYNGYNVMKLYEILAEQNIDEPEANIVIYTNLYYIAGISSLFYYFKNSSTGTMCLVLLQHTASTIISTMFLSLGS